MTEPSANTWSKLVAKGLEGLSGRDAAAAALSAAMFWGGLLWAKSAGDFSLPSRLVHEWASLAVLVAVAPMALVRISLLWFGSEKAKVGGKAQPRTLSEIESDRP